MKMDEDGIARIPYFLMLVLVPVSFRSRGHALLMTNKKIIDLFLKSLMQIHFILYLQE